MTLLFEILENDTAKYAVMDGTSLDASIPLNILSMSNRVWEEANGNLVFIKNRNIPYSQYTETDKEEYFMYRLMAQKL